MELDSIEINDQLKKWRKECDTFSSKISVGYSLEGLSRTVEAIERLTAYIDRLDAIRSQLFAVRASVRQVLYDDKAKFKDGIESIRLKEISKLIASGYSAEERKMKAENNPDFLDLRIKIRFSEKLLINIDEVSKILENKLNSLSRNKYDCKVISDMINFGVAIGDLKGK